MHNSGSSRKNINAEKSNGGGNTCDSGENLVGPLGGRNNMAKTSRSELPPPVCVSTRNDAVGKIRCR